MYVSGISLPGLVTAAVNLSLLSLAAAFLFSRLARYAPPSATSVTRVCMPLLSLSSASSVSYSRG